MTVFLKHSTQIKVRVGPFRNYLDGVTMETGVTLAGDQAELLKANGAATVDISGATWAAVTGASGWYDLTLTTSHTDTIGELIVVVQDDDVHLPVYMRFFVVAQNVYDMMFGSSGDLGTTIDAVHTDTEASQTAETAILSDTEAAVADTEASQTSEAAILADTEASQTAEAAILVDTEASQTAETSILSDTEAVLSDSEAVLTDSEAISADAEAILTDTELWDSAQTEPTGVPAANASPLTKLGTLYMMARNKVTVDSSKKTFFDDSDSAEFEKDLSDDGTTYTESELNAI